jgi:hypothetical protein
MNNIKSISLDRLTEIVLSLAAMGIVNISQLLSLSPQWKGLAVTLRIEMMIVRDVI